MNVDLNQTPMHLNQTPMHVLQEPDLSGSNRRDRMQDIDYRSTTSLLSSDDCAMSIGSKECRKHDPEGSFESTSMCAGHFCRQPFQQFKPSYSPDTKLLDKGFDIGYLRTCCVSDRVTSMLGKRELEGNNEAQGMKCARRVNFHTRIHVRTYHHNDDGRDELTTSDCAPVYGQLLNVSLETRLYDGPPIASKIAVQLILAVFRDRVLSHSRMIEVIKPLFPSCFAQHFHRRGALPLQVQILISCVKQKMAALALELKHTGEVGLLPGSHRLRGSSNARVLHLLHENCGAAIKASASLRFKTSYPD